MCTLLCSVVHRGVMLIGSISHRIAGVAHQFPGVSRHCWQQPHLYENSKNKAKPALSNTCYFFGVAKACCEQPRSWELSRCVGIALTSTGHRPPSGHSTTPLAIRQNTFNLSANFASGNSCVSWPLPQPSELAADLIRICSLVGRNRGQTYLKPQPLKCVWQFIKTNA